MTDEERAIQIRDLTKQLQQAALAAASVGLKVEIVNESLATVGWRHWRIEPHTLIRAYVTREMVL